MSESKTTIGIFFDGKSKNNLNMSREISLLEKVVIEKKLSEFIAIPTWKGTIRDTCVEMGYEVVAISVLKNKKENCDIVVTVRNKLELERKRNKAVTRGGKPIGKPVIKKTMAARRRNAGK